MAFLLNLVLGLAVAGAMGSAVHLWRLHLDGARRDEMQAMAARRGWALTVTGERLGRMGTLRIVPRGGLPWVAEVRPGGMRADAVLTEYEAPEPAWADGTLLLAADGGEPEAARRILGDQASRMNGTSDPLPTSDGVMALARGDVAARVDLQAVSRALREFVPVASGAAGRPVLVLSPDGLRLRLRHPIRRPDQMERFLDLALELSRLIGP